MRYFFHLRSENQMVPDDDGVEIDGAECTHAAVMRALAEISGQIPNVLDRLGEWDLSVCTSSEELVFSLPLREVFSATGELNGCEDRREHYDTVEEAASAA